MLESKDLFQAITNIEDSYIQSAHEFRKHRRTGCKRFAKRGVAAASIAVALIATSVYGASVFVKQLHISSYDNVEDFMEEHDIKSWDAVISVMDGTFDEDVFSDFHPESLIEILSSGRNSEQIKSAITQGSDTDAWIRKWTEEETLNYGDYKNVYYEAYEYEDLADALSEYHVFLDLSYIQANYPQVAGEYGCDFLYSDDSKKECLLQRFFSGYTNAQGDFVSVEYCLDNIDTNEDPYVLFDGKSNTGYYITSDGVEVFLTKAAGASGKIYVTAQVYTEHSTLYVGMYGEFDNSEIEKILDSLDIAEGMNILSIH